MIAKLADGHMLNSKYFCLHYFGPAIIKISVKATKNCVESLTAKGVHGSKIAVLTPIDILDIVHLQNTKKRLCLSS